MTTQTIQAQFDQWNAALLTGDPDHMVAFYAPDAILLPTLSNRVRRDHAAIRDYFVGFLAKHPKGTIDESNVREFGDVAINSGTYTFALTQDGETTNVPCRFTFVYHRTGDDWTIVEHHSSQMPEG